MRAVGRWGGLALLTAVVMLGAGVASASAATAPLKVVLEFDGTGTFSATNGAGTDTPEHSDVQLQWSTTYAGDLQPDGSVTFTATGPGAPGEVTQQAVPPVGTYHFTSSGLDTADCSGSLPAAPGADAPTATLDSSGTLTVQSITSVDQNNASGGVNCQGTDMFGSATDLSADAANLSGTFGPSLPDILTARISVPADALKSGTFTKAVSNADAPAQLPASCADQFGEPEGQCPMSLSWSGTIKITEPCGVVDFSAGEAPPVGTLINPGDIVVTGAKGRIEITLADGAIYRLGPNSKLQCNGQTTFAPSERTDSFKLILGNVWAAVSDALGGDHEFEQSGPVGGTGVRGSAFTASVQPNGDILLHVIQGTGFIKVKGKPEHDFPAGEGFRFDPGSGGYNATSEWPAADRALVPAAQLPPKLTAVRLVGAHAGKRATLHFTVSEKAKVTVQVRRGTHQVLKRTASARRGAGTVTLAPLKRGRYTLMLFATVDKRSAAVQKSFRVT